MSIEQVIRETVRKVLREELPPAMKGILDQDAREKARYIPAAEVLEILNVSRPWWAAAIRDHSSIMKHVRKSNTKSHYWPVRLIEAIRDAGNDLVEGERVYLESQKSGK